MTTLQTRIRWFGVGLIAAWLAVTPALADDTELFTGTAGLNPDVRPNVLFILDTSGSMGDQVDTQELYDPTIAYTGGFLSDRVYWREGTGNPPCSDDLFDNFLCRFGIVTPDTSQWFNESALRCDAAAQAFASEGFLIDRAGQYVPNREEWRRIQTNEKDRLVECEVDGGVHGDGGSALWAQHGDNNNPWSSDPNDEIDWTPGGSNGVRRYTLYDGNWMNWFWYDDSARKTKLEIMQEVSNDILDSISGVNVGLMRFSRNGGSTHELTAEGGMVVWAMEDIETARAGMQAKINSFTAQGNTPLAESLYEAGQYWAGRKVDYGLNSVPEPSIASSRMPGDQSLYKAPGNFACQKNFNILLTDGLPTADQSSESKTEALPGFSTLVGSCDANGDFGNGDCLDDMAEYMFEADLSSLDGQQNVITYTIGFDIDFPLLDATARRGGGEYFTANDTASLKVALTDIFDKILQVNTTFTAPTVSVNAFNRTQNLNDLFVTVFRPSTNTHWPGNVKKYRLNADGEIVDQTQAPAVDPATGFFTDSAQSFWTDGGPDGKNVQLGGAAFEQPAPASRKLYTYTGTSNALTNATNALTTGNTALTDAMLGIGGPGDPTRDNLINWARGVDVNDFDNDPNTTERHAMGDPLHAKPVTVIYGGTAASPDINDAIIFAATNDGYLHAIDPTDGSELWAFVPQQVLPDLKDLFDDPAASNKHYGLDGNLRSLVFDENNNGIIEGNDKVYLYFGMRRGGDTYFALDVTDKTAPTRLWAKDSADYPGLGQTWSTPLPARIDVSGAAYTNNDEKFVLVFGGGYDSSQDNAGYSTDNLGNGIYVVDAVSGDLLWRAGGTGSGADLVVAGMQNAIPGDVRVIDLDQDGFADRLYAADMGGRIFRFDIFSGQARGSLVTGGVFAELGAAGQATPTSTDNRRFYNAPDVSLVNSPQSGRPPYLNVAIGSGYRAHPLNTDTQDRFYSLRDPTVFPKLTQAQFDAQTPITHTDLDDVTTTLTPTIPPDSRGWWIDLAAGEKVLAEARTFSNQIFFTTLTPVGQDPTNPCLPAAQNRLYVVDVLDGSPVTNLDGQGADDALTLSDRGRDLNQGGIAPEVVFLFPEYDPTACPPGETCEPPPPECLVGVEKCEPDFTNAPVRTFWTQDGAT
ncbi:MAG: pilus assembly protein [Gammaproteobacteria bacterium]